MSNKVGGGTTFHIPQSEQLMATFNDKIKDAKKDGMMDLIDVMPVIRNEYAQDINKPLDKIGY